ncbi:hypothetical protein HRbin14_01067 [bacterium HR14]|nr:hypothetical protein HRbin14_01067 [bacterium HR14]
MVLHHIAQGARLIVVAGAPLQPGGLRRGNLHMLHMVAVPQRLQQQVRKPKHENVLNGLLAQVVVNPENLLFAPVGAYLLIQSASAFNIVAEGLLDHQSAIAVGFIVEAELCQQFRRMRKHPRRQRQIEYGVRFYPGVQLLKTFFVQTALHIRHKARGELCPAL